MIEVAGLILREGEADGGEHLDALGVDEGRDDNLGDRKLSRDVMI